MSDIISIANATPGISYSQEKPKVEELIPQHIRENAQGLITFIEDYYDYINQEGLPSKQIRDIVSEHDIDEVSTKFLDGIQGEIAKNIPNSTVLDRVALYKKIVKYYGIKGSEESVTVFFRIFYDEIVSVSYPKEKLFKLSSGNWQNRNTADERQVRANFVAGTLTAGQIGTDFDIFNLAGEKIGSAELSSFTSIDQSFDVPLDETGMELKYDASEISSITFNGSNVALNWTDLKSNVTVDVENGTIYDLDENVFKFDGTDDILRSVAAAGNITIDKEHTLIARIARNDNVTGNHDQCIVSLSNPNNPHQGLELYLDRTSGRIGRRIENLEREMIRLDKSDEITLHNFPEYYGFNDIWYRSTLSHNSHFVWVRNSELLDLTVAQLIENGDADFIAHDGTSWEIYSSKDSNYPYVSEPTTAEVYSAGVKFSIKYFPGGEDTFTLKTPNLNSNRVIVTEDYVFYRYNLNNLLLFKWDDTLSEYYYHTKVYSNTPILSFDYDSVNRKVAMGDYINNEVHLYDLDDWDRFIFIDKILPQPSQQYLFGFSVAIKNNKVYVGRYNQGNENVKDSTLYVYDISDLNSYTVVENHSTIVRAWDNDFLLSANGDDGLNVTEAGSNTTRIPIDNSVDKPISFDYNIDDNEIILGNPSANIVNVYEKNNTGFWVQGDANTSSVDITVTSFDSGDSEIIAWGDFEESFVTDDTGILLSFSYTLTNDNSGVGVDNWNIKQQIQAQSGNTNFGAKVSVDGDNLIVSSPDQKEIHKYLHDGSQYNFLETESSNPDIFVGTDFALKGDKLIVLSLNGLTKPYHYDLNNLSSQTPLAFSFTNSPTQYGFSYGVAEAPVLEALSKYHTIAIRGLRDKTSGYIETSVNGLAWERILEGDTWEYLNMSGTNDLSIGASTGDEDHFNGQLSNVYLYDRLLSAAELTNLKDYVEAINNDWYIIEFDNLEGTLVGVDRIIESANTEYIFDTISGYNVDAFWFFDEARAGDSVSIDVTYGDVITNTQRVNWGDDTSQAFVKQSNGNKLRHVFVGSVLGKYTDTKGRLSDVYKLHDGDYWQEYSYVINPSITPSVWEKEFLSLVHPAGMKYIASLLLLIPRTTDWVGPNITFDEVEQKYVWAKPGDNFLSPYRTRKPLYDTQWMNGLLPPWLYSVDPTDGYHSPIYQPGWLEGLQSLVISLGGIMYPNGANAEELTRVNDLVLKFHIGPVWNRNEAARDDYKQNLKFKDEYEFSDYLYIPISEAIEGFSDTENVIRFNNFPSIITFSTKLPDCIDGGASGTTYSESDDIDGGNSSTTDSEYFADPEVDGGGAGTVICPPLADGGNSSSTFDGIVYDGENSDSNYPIDDPELDGGKS